jgi:hypothetical protein
MRLELEKELELGELSVGCAFKNITTQLIVERNKADECMESMSTIEQKFGTKEIRVAYYFIHHKNGKVTAIDTNGYGERNKEDKKYDDFVQKLKENSLWIENET